MPSESLKILQEKIELELKSMPTIVGYEWPSLRGIKRIVGFYNDKQVLVTTGDIRMPFVEDINTLPRRIAAEVEDFQLEPGRIESKNREKQLEEKRQQDFLDSPLGRFCSSFPPMKAGKVLATLKRNMFVNGVFDHRYSHIERLVASGFKPAENSEGVVLQNAEGVYLLGKDLTQTAIEYAEFLIEQNI